MTSIIQPHMVFQAVFQKKHNIK